MTPGRFRARCVDAHADRPTSLRPSSGHLDPGLGRPEPTLAPLRPPRPHPQLDDLLKEIDEDPLSIFWE
jgi:hypothetical protein